MNERLCLNYAAQMLLVGFCRHWRLKEVASAIGCTWEDAERIHEVAPFMPPFRWAYKTGVRAFMAANWPNLNTFLLAHANDNDKLLSVIPQIERLKMKQSYGLGMRAADRREVNKAKREMLRVMNENAIARDIQKSTQRGAWNVCKA